MTVLRASHIKPWRKSSDKERLDPYNGLLLIPNLDVLFDVGLITFEDNGQIRISDHLSHEDRESLRIHEGLKLKKVFDENKEYLKCHRDNFFKI